MCSTVHEDPAIPVPPFRSPIIGLSGCNTLEQTCVLCNDKPECYQLVLHVLLLMRSLVLPVRMLVLTAS